MHKYIWNVTLEYNQSQNFNEKSRKDYASINLIFVMENCLILLIHFYFIFLIFNFGYGKLCVVLIIYL